MYWCALTYLCICTHVFLYIFVFTCVYLMFSILLPGGGGGGGKRRPFQSKTSVNIRF